MSKLKKILFSAMFLATTVVFNRFLSIKTPIIMISFTFVPIMLCAILLGPWWTMAVAGLADLIGALLFPFGAYFVGYTISSALSGLIYGLFLKYKPHKSQKRIILDLVLSILIVIVICNAFLNSLWIYMTTKKALAVILPTRLLKQLIMFPVEVVTMSCINLGLTKMGVYKKLFENTDEEMEEDENGFKLKNENQDKEMSLKLDEVSQNITDKDDKLVDIKAREIKENTENNDENLGNVNALDKNFRDKTNDLKIDAKNSNENKSQK